MLSDSYFDQLNTCDNDNEILTGLLKMMVPELDEKRFARLIEHEFNGIHSLLSARYSTIKQKSELSDDAVKALKYIHSIVLRFAKISIRHRNLNSCIGELYSYLLLKMSCLDQEFLLIFLLNSENHLLSEEVVATGVSNRLVIHPTQIIKKVMDTSASAFILAHNHPSNNPKPSKLDIESTNGLDDVCRALSISFHDHLIVGRDRILSMKQDGYF